MDAKIIWLWARGRVWELWRGTRTPVSHGLRILDGALAMASIRLDMKTVRVLVEKGGDASVRHWLPGRMAACAGDAETLRWLLSKSRPSDYALDSARLWALQNGHADVLDILLSEIDSRRMTLTHPE